MPPGLCEFNEHGSPMHGSPMHPGPCEVSSIRPTTGECRSPCSAQGQGCQRAGHEPNMNPGPQEQGCQRASVRNMIIAAAARARRQMATLHGQPACTTGDLGDSGIECFLIVCVHVGEALHLWSGLGLELGLGRV